MREVDDLLERRPASAPWSTRPRHCGGELFLSQHMVKTQALSIYRKPSASSRS
jgi:hypothetical protein